MRYEHEIVFGDLELVRIEGGDDYVVDREREVLRNLDSSKPDLKLTQRQHGRRQDGDSEILERYASDDENVVVILDASPAFLEEHVGPRRRGLARSD
jgi:hypothetical protein